MLSYSDKDGDLEIFTSMRSFTIWKFQLVQHNPPWSRLFAPMWVAVKSAHQYWTANFCESNKNILVKSNMICRYAHLNYSSSSRTHAEYRTFYSKEQIETQLIHDMISLQGCASVQRQDTLLPPTSQDASDTKWRRQAMMPSTLGPWAM
jgi:hypothetical protein